VGFAERERHRHRQRVRVQDGFPMNVVQLEGMPGGAVHQNGLRYRAFASAAEFDRELAGLVNENNIDLVCLAGYMKILSREFLDSVRAKVMNVHPALLPCFGGEGMYGMHVHEAVIESGVRVSGCTVHFVDYGADTGPIIIQKAVPVEPGDTPGSLQKKILPFEHEAYAEAVKLYCADRLEVKGKKVFIK